MSKSKTFTSLFLGLLVAAANGDATGCDCSWASSDTCQPSSDDGSVCWKECCGSQPVPPSGQVAMTTRYWDCCKPSCAWDDKSPLAPGATPVRTCGIDGSVQGSSAVSVCGGGGVGGPAYMCADQHPWMEGDGMLYGFAAGRSEDCCKCFELTFLEYSVDSNGNRCDSCSSYDGALAGSKMILQVTNTGGDLATQQFDIQIPGGGFGIYNGCASNGNEPANGPGQYSTPYSAWGARYGGVLSESGCSQLPSELQAGCEFRFNGFRNADNPGAVYTQVACPSQLVAKTGCRRSDEPGAVVLEAEEEGQVERRSIRGA